MHGEFPKKNLFGEVMNVVDSQIRSIQYCTLSWWEEEHHDPNSWPFWPSMPSILAPILVRLMSPFFSKMIFLIIIILIACEKSVKHCLSICHCNKLPPSFAEDLSVCNLHFEDQLFFTICKCANVRRNPDRFWHVLMNRKRLG